MLGCLHGAIDIVAAYSQRPKTAEIFEGPSIRAASGCYLWDEEASFKPPASVWLRKLASAERSMYSDGPKLRRRTGYSVECWDWEKRLWVCKNWS